jgi:hypothetical protein
MRASRWGQGNGHDWEGWQLQRICHHGDPIQGRTGYGVVSDWKDWSLPIAALGSKESFLHIPMGRICIYGSTIGVSWQCMWGFQLARQQDTFDKSFLYADLSLSGNLMKQLTHIICRPGHQHIKRACHGSKSFTSRCIYIPSGRMLAYYMSSGIFTRQRE